MRKLKFGYEANGGFLLGSDVHVNQSFLKALPTRDAILPMLSVIGLAKRYGVRVSKLVEALPKRFTFSDRIQNFHKEQSEALFNKKLVSDRDLIKALLPVAGSVTEINNLDGLRVTFSTSDIIHIRLSGNAPELRCYVESNSYDKARRICHEALSRVLDLHL